MSKDEELQKSYEGLMQEISELRAQAASLEVFKNALYNAPSPAMLHAEDGEIIFINSVWTELSGYTLQDIPTISVWAEKAYGQLKALEIPTINKLYDLEERLDEGEDYVTTSDGTVRTWYFSSAPVGKLPDGRRLVISAAIDRTDSEQAEDLLWKHTISRSILGSITQQIQQCLDLSVILDIVAAEVRDLFQADRVIVFQRQDEGDEVIVRAEALDSRLSPILASSFIDPWRYDASYSQGKPSVTTSGDINAQAALSQFTKQHNIQAAIAAPIVKDNRIWGAVCIWQHFAAPSWKPFVIDFIGQLVIQLAFAIRQSELYQHIQYLNANLERQVEERTLQLQQALTFEATLKRVGERVRNSLNEQQILETSAHELMSQLSLNGCSTTSYNAQAETCIVLYRRNSAAKTSYSSIGIEDLTGLYSKLRQGKPFQCYSTELKLPWLGDRQALVLACPIISRNITLGHFWLLRDPFLPFSVAEISLVEQVANYCSSAIHQVRLYEASQEQVAKLTELSQLKDDFLSTVSHELRTPLTNIEMAIQMLTINLEKSRMLESSAPLGRYLSILQAECNREIELVNDLLDLQRLQAKGKPLKLEEIELHAWLSKMTRPFQERVQTNGQTLRLTIPEGPCIITSDEAMLKRIVVELLNNACKYTPAGEQIVVSVELQPERLQLQVRNSGVEIPNHQLERIFERFYRIQDYDRWKQGGTGLGLALVKDLVELLAGDITVTSQDRQTIFTVRLPLADAQTAV